MLDVLRESLGYLFITTVVSIIFAPIMIALLYKFGQVSEITKSNIGTGKGTNEVFINIMNVKKTNGTPNMGGVLILLVVPILTYFLIPITPVLKVLLIGFILFGVWGLLDVLIFTNLLRKIGKMKVYQETFGWRLGKLTIAILLNIGVMFLLFNTGMFTTLSFFNILSLSITPLIVILVAVIGQFAIYAGELTDGLDGLMVGIFTIISSCLAVLLLIQGQYEFIPFLAIIIGVQIVDLYFNIPPARFWNGGPGAMPLAFSIFFISLVTDNLIPFFFMTSITWIIMFSSMIQLLSLKFFNKRVFKIAPLHHHFQAVGWPQYKVTMRFWLFTFFLCIVGIYLGLI